MLLSYLRVFAVYRVIGIACYEMYVTTQKIIVLEYVFCYKKLYFKMFSVFCLFLRENRCSMNFWSPCIIWNGYRRVTRFPSSQVNEIITEGGLEIYSSNPEVTLEEKTWKRKRERKYGMDIIAMSKRWKQYNNKKYACENIPELNI